MLDEITLVTRKRHSRMSAAELLELRIIKIFVNWLHDNDISGFVHRNNFVTNFNRFYKIYNNKNHLSKLHLKTMPMFKTTFFFTVRVHSTNMNA